MLKCKDDSKIGSSEYKEKLVPIKNSLAIMSFPCKQSVVFCHFCARKCLLFSLYGFSVWERESCKCLLCILIVFRRQIIHLSLWKYYNKHHSFQHNDKVLCKILEVKWAARLLQLDRSHFPTCHIFNFLHTRISFLKLVWSFDDKVTSSSTKTILIKVIVFCIGFW